MFSIKIFVVSFLIQSLKCLIFSMSHLQLDLLLQVLVGSLQQLLSAQNTVPHHILGTTPVWGRCRGGVQEKDCCVTSTLKHTNMWTTHHLQHNHWNGGNYNSIHRIITQNWLRTATLSSRQLVIVFLCFSENRKTDIQTEKMRILDWDKWLSYKLKKGRK